MICQEEYDCAGYFHPLKAPKNDGISLVRALRQMDFQVFAFANITLQVIRLHITVLAMRFCQMSKFISVHRYMKIQVVVFFKARAKRGPSLFEVSDQGGIHTTWVFLTKVAFVFGVLS